VTPVHHEPGPARRPTLAYSLEKRGKRLVESLLRALLRPRPLDGGALERLEVRQLLVIRQHNQMGDMVLCLPALRALRERWPEAHLRFVTAPICEELLQGHEDIDELIVFRKREMRRPAVAWRWLRALRQPRPDLALVLGSVSFSTTSALLALASRAPVRIGASSRPFGSGLSEAIYHRELPEPDGIHELDRNLSTLEPLGIRTSDRLPHLRASTDTVVAARAFLGPMRPGERLVVVHVGAGKLPNVWPGEYFAQCIDRLARSSNLRVVLTEGPRDATLVQDVQQQAGVTLSRWRRPLGDTLGLLDLAALVVSNDTGMAHVAAALGRPTLVLFGPTDPNRWRPVGPAVQVLQSPTRRIIDLPVDEVVQAAAAVLDAQASPSVNP